eukprot:3858940-Prymnesium_polylepis.2
MHGAVGPWAFSKAHISVGSPSGVPVPCTSTRSSCTTPAAARTMLTKWACAVPLGAVRLALLPSERTKLPSSGTQATLAEPNVTAATLSPRAYPLALASNVLHRPSIDSIPARTYAQNVRGISIRLTARVSVAAHSFRANARDALCSATRADEHAVS